MSLSIELEQNCITKWNRTIAHALMSLFKTFDSKRKTQKEEKIVFQMKP